MLSPRPVHPPEPRSMQQWHGVQEEPSIAIYPHRTMKQNHA